MRPSTAALHQSAIALLPRVSSIYSRSAKRGASIPDKVGINLAECKYPLLLKKAVKLFFSMRNKTPSVPVLPSSVLSTVINCLVHLSSKSIENIRLKIIEKILII
jgi:hypothetical protein